MGIREKFEQKQIQVLKQSKGKLQQSRHSSLPVFVAQACVLPYLNLQMPRMFQYSIIPDIPVVHLLRFLILQMNRPEAIAQRASPSRVCSGHSSWQRVIAPPFLRPEEPSVFSQFFRISRISASNEPHFTFLTEPPMTRADPVLVPPSRVWTPQGLSGEITLGRLCWMWFWPSPDWKPTGSHLGHQTAKIISSLLFIHRHR